MRQGMKHLWGGPLAATLLLLAGVACTPAEDPAGAAPQTAEAPPRSGGRIVVGIPFDVNVWNEYLATRDTAVQWIRRLYLPLAVQADTGSVADDAFEWLLAESVDRSEDGTELTFTLREATWSDGQPITARDVVFTWRAQTAEPVSWRSSSKMRIADVVADPADPRRVTFKFDGTYPYQLADAVEGSILPQHVFGEIPFDQWRQRDWSVAEVVSGPFQLASQRPGESFVLERNPVYFREGLPRLDEIVVRIVTEPTAMRAQLESGELDMALKLAPREADRLKSTSAVSLISYPYPDIHVIGWNERREPFDDVRVRRAMTLALDRQGLIDQFVYGQGAPTATIVASYTAGANRRLQPLPYDPDEARRLLRQAGYGGDGKTLSFQLVTNAGNELRRDLATAVQAQLAEIGVDVRLSVVDSGQLNRLLGSGEYDAFLRGLVLTGNPDLGVVFGSDGGFNVVGYRSTEVDSWLARMDSMSGWDAIKDALDKIQQEVHDDQPFTHLFERRGLTAHRDTLADFEVDIPVDPLARLDRTWRRGA